MTHLATEGNELYEQGWNQGSYIPCSELPETLKQAFIASGPGLIGDFKGQLSDSRNIAIVISQTCDITANSSHEPAIEFILARRPRNSRRHSPGQFNLNGQSSRYWEFQIDDIWHKAQATKICFVSKTGLLNATRDYRMQPRSLCPNQKLILARWRANRYYRTPLPSSFEEKIKPLCSQGLLDVNLSGCSSLYLNLDPLTEAEAYKIRLFGLQHISGTADTYRELASSVETILEVINHTDGLSCNYLTGEDSNHAIFNQIEPAMRRTELTIHIRDYFTRWNLDYISIREEDLSGLDDYD